ncbi:MAG TPA: hypothetical protein ENN06_10820 [Desulfobacteraceae bacterium]|nr:hypothetical protein [Desulfobacteraceae bacterium]
MNRYLALIILLLPVAASGQHFSSMSESDLRDMTQQMERFQTCIEQIDQEAMKEIDRRSIKVEALIQSLCARGKRDEAQEKALSWAREAAAEPAVQEMKRCGEIMKEQIPDLPFLELEEDIARHHVCDAE